MNAEVLQVICPEPATARGGADFHVRDLAVALRERGTATQVLVLGDPGFAGEIRDAGCPACSAAIARGPHLVAEFLRRSSPDRPRIVHGHGYEADYAASLGRVRARRGHFVATAHGFLRIDRRMRVMTALNMLCLRNADAVITAGALLAGELSPTFASVTHVPNGTTAPARPARPKSRRRPRLGFVGRLSPEKRPGLVVETSRRLAERGVEHDTLLYGGGPLSDEVARRAAGVAGSTVRMMGFERDIDALYDELDVLVVCSDAESSPRVVLEAMARGVAVVASAVGDLSEILDGGRCGVLVDPDDLDELVEGCERLLTDEAARASLAARARRRWEAHYRLDVMIDHTQEVYRRVVG